MRHPTFLQLHHGPRTWLVSLALSMLVLMQTLGGIHAVLHHGDAASLTGFADDSPFGLHAEHSGDCQLFDQLAHADLASLPAHPWTPSTADTPVFLPAGTLSVPGQSRPFRARDPPGHA